MQGRVGLQRGPQHPPRVLLSGRGPKRAGAVSARPPKDPSRSGFNDTLHALLVGRYSASRATALTGPCPCQFAESWMGYSGPGYGILSLAVSEKYIWCLDYKGGLFCSALPGAGLRWQKFEDAVQQVAVSPSGSPPRRPAPAPLWPAGAGRGSRSLRPPRG